MKRYLAAALLLAGGQPEQPATTSPDKPAGAAPATPRPASTTDTLHVADSLGRPAGVLRLQPSTQAAFQQLRDALPLRPSDAVNATDTSDAALPADGRVQRQGGLLVLRPAQGPPVTLRPVPSPDGPEGNDNTYLYWGSLPAARQWVIDVVTDEGPAVLLIDQRTGRRTQLLGAPSVSPDGQYLLSACEDVASGSNPTNLSLYRCTAAGPQLVWSRDLANWGPRAARWRDARHVVLAQAHADAGGDVQAATQLPLTYAELEILPNP
ncbi:hypothetical protein [Hymenobacter sp. CRA2]|uniref:hypothetical protein n=1 Tax=Hymenobacter sp. CRA2 TaxID=1955620 RepID=UPI00098FEB5A|nr:hypothetical protein [Hymenobacter sp. CRA2]OON70892.1 hypothetical protein B0919_02495 [Hymenobacter sp. CRA2]